MRGTLRAVGLNELFGCLLACTDSTHADHLDRNDSTCVSPPSRILRSAAPPRNELPHPSPLIDEQPRAVTIIQLLRPWFIVDASSRTPGITRRAIQRIKHSSLAHDGCAIRGRVHAVVRPLRTHSTFQADSFPSASPSLQYSKLARLPWFHYCLA